MRFDQALVIAQAGLEEWAAKPHNRRWWKRIDGTPIPNDLLVVIASGFTTPTPEMSEGIRFHSELTAASPEGRGVPQDEIIDRLQAQHEADHRVIEGLRDGYRELSDAVFGCFAGDEPNVYADYDRLSELHGRSIALLEGGGVGGDEGKQGDTRSRYLAPSTCRGAEERAATESPFTPAAMEALRDLADLPDYLKGAVRSHIKTMYPEAVKAASGTFLLSVGNHVSNYADAVVTRVLKDLGATVKAPATDGEVQP